MSDVRGELLQQIKDKAVVHGKVTLSSGLEADYYVDLRRVTLDGEAAPLVGQVMLDLTADLEFDAVGGLTMGADPVAGAMLHAAAARGRKLDAFVVRKAAKAHGLQRRIEGPDIKGRRVLVVEDTSTTGGSPLDRRRGGARGGRRGRRRRDDRRPGDRRRREDRRRARACRTSSPTPRTSSAWTEPCHRRTPPGAESTYAWTPAAASGRVNVWEDGADDDVAPKV